MGLPLRKFGASRGLRQGDPFSNEIFGAAFRRESYVVEFWDLLVEEVERRLEGWKKAFLSSVGRITLIQSVLISFTKLLSLPALNPS